MKISKEKEDLNKLNNDELRKKIDSLRSELFNICLNSSTAHVKDYSQFKKLRKTIARALEILKGRGESDW